MHTNCALREVDNNLVGDCQVCVGQGAAQVGKLDFRVNNNEDIIIIRRSGRPDAPGILPFPVGPVQAEQYYEIKMKVVGLKDVLTKNRHALMNSERLNADARANLEDERANRQRDRLFWRQRLDAEKQRTEHAKTAVDNIRLFTEILIMLVLILIIFLWLSTVIAVNYKLSSMESDDEVKKLSKENFSLDRSRKDLMEKLDKCENPTPREAAAKLAKSNKAKMLTKQIDGVGDHAEL